MIVEKTKIIERVHKKGNSFDGLLMAFYSQESFTRQAISIRIANLLKDPKSVKNAFDSCFRRRYIERIGDTTPAIYHITKAGITYLFKMYPLESGEMSNLLSPMTIPQEIRSKVVDIEAEYAYLLGTSKTASEKKITEECKEVNRMLLNKNRRYGNSSLEPFGLFPKVSKESKVEARIEDKLSRIKTMADDKYSADYIDAVRDLTGYLILYHILLKE
jgi:hypothetical protein